MSLKVVLKIDDLFANAPERGKLLRMFTPTQNAAFAQLNAFVPRAGKDYASTRNFDFGPQKHTNVSTLSPYLRTRLLTEWTVIETVLKEHSKSAAAKFIDEVCWRTYWKGYLEQRPQIWEEYCRRVPEQIDTHQARPYYKKATEGTTGINFFDAWSRELTETGYMHNHARMWFSSIWIHTLGLPWELGADFFLRHLFDGDPASNTLSWRWVAGLHTPGKTYLARSGNIKRYTDGRFDEAQGFDELTSSPRDIEDDFVKPSPCGIEPLETHLPNGRVGLLLHEDDLSASEWIQIGDQADVIFGCIPHLVYERFSIDDRVFQFRKKALQSVLPKEAPIVETAGAIISHAQKEKLTALVLAKPFVGLWDPVCATLEAEAAKSGIAIIYRRHWWDDHFFPHATAGFFKLKKQIPQALERL